MIYFMQPLAGGPIKIGCTNNVELRRKQLDRHYGVPLRVLLAMDGDRVAEQEIHDRFSHLRIGNTEQFLPRSELAEFLNIPAIDGFDFPAMTSVVIEPGTSPAKIDRGVLVKARAVAKAKNVKLSQYLLSLLAGPIDRDFLEEMKKLHGGHDDSE